jgi:hypothetical protein
MKYLIDKDYNVITTADDDYEYMLLGSLEIYPGSMIVDSVPIKPVVVAKNQPISTGTTPV